jgi:ribulose-phosphate 3-epimerase
MVQISASILAADFSRLGEDITRMTAAGIDRFHWNIMDGLFTPNITFGSAVVKSLCSFTDKPFDIHLMVHPEALFLEQFIAMRVNSLIVHSENNPHIYQTLLKIKAAGVKAGLALNPGISIIAMQECLETVDIVLIMTVNPGFGGQTLLTSMIAKISSLRMMADQKKLNFSLQVDGGVNEENSTNLIKAGVTVLVSGSTIFNSKSPALTIQRLKGNVPLC